MFKILMAFSATLCSVLFVFGNGKWVCRCSRLIERRHRCCGLRPTGRPNRVVQWNNTPLLVMFALPRANRQTIHQLAALPSCTRRSTDAVNASIAPIHSYLVHLARVPRCASDSGRRMRSTPAVLWVSALSAFKPAGTRNFSSCWHKFRWGRQIRRHLGRSKLVANRILALAEQRTDRRKCADSVPFGTAPGIISRHHQISKQLNSPMVPWSALARTARISSVPARLRHPAEPHDVFDARNIGRIRGPHYRNFGSGPTGRFWMGALRTPE